MFENYKQKEQKYERWIRVLERMYYYALSRQWTDTAELILECKKKRKQQRKFK